MWLHSDDECGDECQERLKSIIETGVILFIVSITLCYFLYF